MIVNKKKYFDPDSIWTVKEIKNHEEYISQYVIKGNFHKLVHEDIIKSYETAEYLMAHAYYHWPMYDEARKKVLGIFEMAVKLRNQELGNSLSTTLKNGKNRKKNLVQLINELQNFDYPNDLVKRFHWLRELRNYDSHPERHSFAGATFIILMFRAVNLINEMFLPPRLINEKIEHLEDVKTRNKELLKGLFLLPEDNKAILIHDPEIINCWKTGDEWNYVFSFKPVLKNTKALLEEDKIINPFVKTLQNLKIDSNEITAFDVEASENIKISRNTRQSNIDSYKKHLKELKELDDLRQFANASNYSSTVNNYTEKAICRDWNHIFV